MYLLNHVLYWGKCIGWPWQCIHSELGFAQSFIRNTGTSVRPFQIDKWKSNKKCILGAPAQENLGNFGNHTVSTRSPTWEFRPEDKTHKYNSTNSIENMTWTIKFMLTDFFVADDELFGKRSNPVANQPTWEFFVGWIARQLSGGLNRRNLTSTCAGEAILLFRRCNKQTNPHTNTGIGKAFFAQ